MTYTDSLAGHLAWPVVLLVLALVFKTKLSTLLDNIARRIRKVKGAGFELEMDRSLEEAIGEAATELVKPEVIQPAAEPGGAAVVPAPRCHS